jgi:endonuclease YncB( thermonuclease family)
MADIALYGWSAGLTQSGRINVVNNILTLYIGGYGTVFPLPSGTYRVDVLENKNIIATYQTGGSNFNIIAGRDYEVRAVTPGAAVMPIIIKGRVTDDTGKSVGVGTVSMFGRIASVAYDGTYSLGLDTYGADVITYSGPGYETVSMSYQTHTGTSTVNFATRSTGIVSPPVSPPGATPNTPQKQAWMNFFHDPSYYNFTGTLVAATQESFSRVFSSWSVTDDAPADPRPGDYVAVGLVLGGLSLAASTTVYAGIYALITGAPFLSSIGGIAGASSTMLRAADAAPSTIPGLIRALFEQAAKNPLITLVLISQLDVIAWGGGFAPTYTHNAIQQAFNSFNSYKISLETAIKKPDWVLARTMLDNMKGQLAAADKLLKSFNVAFFSAFGVSFEDLKQSLADSSAAVSAYEKAYPQLARITPSFPAEIIVTNCNVLDGDTIEWPNHSEAMNKVRFIGMDAHESGTDAGKVEMDYLKSLVQGRTVTLKVDWLPENQVDTYGRLLAVPYVGDQNVVKLMLQKFGKSILTAAKYQTKYQYVDWDELKAAASGSAVTPTTQAFTISIDSVPSNAKLYIDGTYTHHYTPADEKELKDVMALLTPGQHTFKATKGGAVGEKTVMITGGSNPAFTLELSSPGLPPVAGGGGTITPSTLESRVSSLEAMIAAIAAKLGV